ncbi:MAG: hypothetical protein ABJA67_18725 [Chthonomonadales bacterium]
MSDQYTDSYPDWLEEAYYERFGASIAQIKEAVGEGISHENRAAEVMVSPNGAWFECIELPLEFAGAAGVDPKVTYPTHAEAIALINNLYSTRNEVALGPGGRVSLFALYSPQGVFDSGDVYSFRLDTAKHEPMREWGKFRPTAEPIAFRYSVAGGRDEEVGALNDGFLFYLSGVGDMNVLVVADAGGEQIFDLSPPEQVSIQ